MKDKEVVVKTNRAHRLLRLLQGEKAEVLETVSKDGNALQHVSAKFQEDIDVVRAACTVGIIGRDPFDSPLKYAKDGPKSDRNLILDLVSLNGFHIQHAIEKLQKDRQVVLAAVTKGATPTPKLTESNDIDLCDEGFLDEEDGGPILCIPEGAINLLEDGAVLRPGSTRLYEIPPLGIGYEDERHQYTPLGVVPEEWRSDEMVVLEALRSNPCQLEHASSKLLTSREFALRCIDVNGYAFDVICDEFRTDFELVVRAWHKTFGAEPYVPYVRENWIGDTFSDFQKDSWTEEDEEEELDLIEEISQGSIDTDSWCSKILMSTPKWLREERDAWPFAINWRKFKSAHHHAKGDPEFVLLVMGIWPEAFKYASKKVRSNPKVVEEARKYSWLSEYILAAPSEDQPSATKSPIRNRLALKSATKEQRNDPIFVLRALEEDLGNLKYLSKELLSDLDFALEVVGRWPFTYIKFHSLQNNPQLAKLAVELDVALFSKVPTELTHNPEFVLSLVEKQPTVVCHAPKFMREDREFVLKAIGRNPKALEDLHPWDDDQAFVIAQIDVNANTFCYASRKVRGDISVAEYAVKRNKALMKCVLPPARAELVGRGYCDDDQEGEE